jgi:hypothetical protein
MRFSAVRIAAFVLSAVGLTAWASASPITIANWTFEVSQPSSSGQTNGPHAPEEGAGSAVGFHDSSATTWSSPVGNGSPRSWSSNNWSVGDYYQFQVSTLGLQDIMVSWHQTGSNTGPRDFWFQYSTDGTNFTDHLSYSITNDSWSSLGAPKPESIYSADLSAVSALENQAAVYFRITQRTTTSITGATVAPGGTGRVDNFHVTGIPEPASLGLLVLGGLAMMRRRR